MLNYSSNVCIYGDTWLYENGEISTAHRTETPKPIWIKIDTVDDVSEVTRYVKFYAKLQFLRATARSACLARISYRDSVRPSVCLPRPGTDSSPDFQRL